MSEADVCVQFLSHALLTKFLKTIAAKLQCLPSDPLDLTLR